MLPDLPDGHWRFQIWFRNLKNFGTLVHITDVLGMPVGIEKCPVDIEDYIVAWDTITLQQNIALEKKFEEQVLRGKDWEEFNRVNGMRITDYGGHGGRKG